MINGIFYGKILARTFYPIGGVTVIPEILDAVSPDLRLAFALCLYHANSSGRQVSKTLAGMPKPVYTLLWKENLIVFTASRVRPQASFLRLIDESVRSALLQFIELDEHREIRESWRTLYDAELQANKTRSDSFSLLNRSAPHHRYGLAETGRRNIRET